MITRGEIDAMAKQLEVPPADVERDYVFGWLLSCLYRENPLGKLLVLKGGNCLRKGYFPEGRYSPDLDFSTSSRVPEEVLRRELNSICASVQTLTGVVFNTDRTRVDEPREVDGHKIVTKARVYFRDFYGEEVEQSLKVKVDVTQFDRLYMRIQDRELISAGGLALDCVARHPRHVPKPAPHVLPVHTGRDFNVCGPHGSGDGDREPNPGLARGGGEVH